jgi:hypothetical protein
VEKETELRKELLSTIEDIRNLTRLLTGNISMVDQLGRELLKELQSVEGWEIMINRPFDSSECIVDYSFSDQIIEFVMEGETLLTIRLDMKIKDQVRKAKELYGKEIWRTETWGEHIQD